MFIRLLREIIVTVSRGRHEEILKTAMYAKGYFVCNALLRDPTVTNKIHHVL